MNQLNPLKILQLKTAWDQFQIRHPKFPPFLNTLTKEGIAEGSVIEITVTDVDGKTINSNLKVTPEDIQLLESLKELMEHS